MRYDKLYKIIKNKSYIILITCLLPAMFFSIAHTAAKKQKSIIIPDVNYILDIAAKNGKINTFIEIDDEEAKQEPTLSFDYLKTKGSTVPIFNAYNFGSDEITLSTGVAYKITEYAIKNILPEDQVIIVGTGYISLLTALYLKEANYKNVIIVSNQNDLMINSIQNKYEIKNQRKVQYYKNNGILVPTKIVNFLNNEKWNNIITNSHNEWQKIAKNDICKNICKPINLAILPNKSNIIKQINEKISPKLYKENKSYIFNKDIVLNKMKRKYLRKININNDILIVNTEELMNNLLTKLNKQIYFYPETIKDKKDLLKFTNHAKLIINTKNNKESNAEKNDTYQLIQLLIPKKAIDKNVIQENAFWFGDYFITYKPINSAETEIILGGKIANTEKKSQNIVNILNQTYNMAHYNCKNKNNKCLMIYENKLQTSKRSASMFIN